MNILGISFNGVTIMATSSFDKKFVITKEAAEAIVEHLEKPVVKVAKQVKVSSKMASKAMLAKRVRLH